MLAAACSSRCRLQIDLFGKVAVDGGHATCCVQLKVPITIAYGFLLLLVAMVFEFILIVIVVVTVLLVVIV